MAAAGLALGGCYRYTPVEPGAVPPGSDVQVHVERGVRLSVGAVPVAMSRDGIVNGKVVRPPAGDTLFCEVLLDPPGQARRGLRGTVPVPLASVGGVEVRSLDRGRTAALVAGGALLARVAVGLAFHVSNPDSPGAPPGGENNARIEIFRVRF